MSRVRRDHPRCRSAMWICMCGHTPDVVIYSKFHRNPLRGFGAPGGRNLPIPITLAIGFYNSLHYRASRDIVGYNGVVVRTPPHHVWKYGNIQSETAEIRRGKNRKKKKPQGKNIMVCLFHWATIINQSLRRKAAMDKLIDRSPYVK